MQKKLFRNYKILFFGNRLLVFFFVVCFFPVALYGCSSSEIVKTIENSSTRTPIPNVQITQQPSTPTKDFKGTIAANLTPGIHLDLDQIPTPYPEDGKLRYKDAFINFTFMPKREDHFYINLDDLGSNTPENSDLIVDVSFGNKYEFVTFHTLNGASYYFTGNDKVDYSTCLANLPVTNLSQIDYDIQGRQAATGQKYCVLTDLGKIAIVNLVGEDSGYKPDGAYLLSINLSVFK